MTRPTDRRGEPNRADLFALATSQRGYFTAAQANECGYGYDDLAHHTRTGDFLHQQRGLYRFRDYPSAPRDEVVEACLALGAEFAIVSHTSALELWGLSDLIPDTIHLVVPRSHRYAHVSPWVTLHTTTRAVVSGDVRVLDGIRLTGPVRTLIDVAEAGVSGEQIEMAVRQAIQLGWTDSVELRTRSTERGHRVSNLIESALAEMRQPV